MKVLNKTANAGGELKKIAPSAALSPFVDMFVLREEVVDGRAVRILPETRSSVQFRLEDSYWVKERMTSTNWRRVPDISVWGPRHNWGYGYAASHIKIYAFSLTPAGARAVFCDPVSSYVDRVLDVSDLGLLQELKEVELSDCFETWVGCISKILVEFFEDFDPTPPISTNAVSMLATGRGGSVTKAAQLEGISPRQFRRRFTSAYGLGPKQYQRLIRVDRQIRQLHSTPWERDQFESIPVSFADQAHSIREFQEILGMTPMQYWHRKRGADNTIRSTPEPGVLPPD